MDAIDETILLTKLEQQLAYKRYDELNLYNLDKLQKEVGIRIQKLMTPKRK